MTAMERPEPPITRRLVLKDKGFEFVDDPPRKGRESDRVSETLPEPESSGAREPESREPEPSANS